MWLVWFVNYVQGEGKIVEILVHNNKWDYFYFYMLHNLLVAYLFCLDTPTVLSKGNLLIYFRTNNNVIRSH